MIVCAKQDTKKLIIRANNVLQVRFKGRVWEALFVKYVHQIHIPQQQHINAPLVTKTVSLIRTALQYKIVNASQALFFKRNPILVFPVKPGFLKAL